MLNPILSGQHWLQNNAKKLKHSQTDLKRIEQTQTVLERAQKSFIIEHDLCSEKNQNQILNFPLFSF